MPQSIPPVPSALRSLLVLVASVGMVGCATLIHGSSQEIVVESTPSEAQVEVNGRPVGETPTTTVLKRNREYSISIYQEGYEPHHTTLRPGRSLWATVNLLNFFVPGLLVDASTGALYSLDPSTVAPELQPVDSTAVDPPPSDEEGGAP
ncbi:PEGA domain-containing protein [Salinibacter ruber]|uniref:PEGA domain-containing protein n=1 Tax=Salinibacter ruber TaxID=146919 RepID=UPI0021690333|nr:PEGA domain-containing protein [Salinibacter ruber]MCS3755554.1 hypothetical protein [Salinibacter ruber]MCS4085520.1 hypothetical protein [Salinibacter ruber]